MRHRRLLVCCLALSLGTTASVAAPAVRVALHLSEVVDATPDDVARVHAIVSETLSRRGANLAGSDRIDAFFAARPPHSCAPLTDAERTQCLAELARGVDADRSVLVTIAPYAGERIILTAQVVSSGGTVLQEIEPSTYRRTSKTALQQSIGTALHDFVPKLQIFELQAPGTSAQSTSTTSASADTANRASTPQAMSPVTASPSSLSRGFAGTGLSNRTAGLIIGGLGLALGGIGGYYLGAAGMHADRFNDVYREGRPGIEDEGRLASMRSQATRAQLFGVVFVGAGIGAVLGGAYLLWSDGNATRARSTLSWLIGPNSMAVRVEVP
jgi:hypothetical protein